MTGTPQQSRRTLLRTRDAHARVTYLELFFDLVYVFAITQLSHTLQHELDWLGLARTAELFLAVWWVWMFTAWATNWADPERVPVRLLLIAAMALSLVMTISLPDAFAGAGLWFAASYVAIQLGRTLAMVAVFGRANREGARNMQRIAAWFAAGGVFWLIGALAAPDARLRWWALALAIEYAGPLCFFAVPGLGRSSAEEWDISGGHLAERAALFIIIALGEGIVVTGATVSAAGLAGPLAWAFGIAFAGSAAMWWLYFDLGAARGSERIEREQRPGRLARSAYTYIHMPIAAGIVICAVADTLLLDAPAALAGPALVRAECGGMALYLLGLGLFKKSSSEIGNFPLSHIVGLALLAGLALAGTFAAIPALVLAALAVAVLVLVAALEWRSFHPR